MKVSEAKYLHYKKYGSGPKHLLAFHGFGQDHSAFSFFEDSLGREFTIISFDLPFHGASAWPEESIPIPITEWEKHLAEVIDREKIERFSLLGYSLGGKVALATSFLFAERIEQVIVVAPDGVYINPWYTIATGTTVMRRIFHFLTTRPRLLAAIIRLTVSLRLISKNLGRFAASQVANHENGRRIYNSWVGFREFTKNNDEIVALMNSHHIKLTTVAGQHDSVIPWRRLRAIAQKCTSHEWILIKTGHQSLLKRYHKLLMERQAESPLPGR